MQEGGDWNRFRRTKELRFKEMQIVLYMISSKINS